MSLRVVTLHYHRLPDRVQVFRQPVLAWSAECIVTLLEAAPLRAPLRVAGRVVLEPGAPVVWCTYPGRGYDVGRFHRADGRFTGYYANLLTPVQIDGDQWRTTDLFLDVWQGVDGGVHLLDADELAAAVANGWLSAAEAKRVRGRAAALVAAAEAGEWPPPPAAEWSLERARERLAELTGAAAGRPLTR